MSQASGISVVVVEDEQDLGEEIVFHLNQHEMLAATVHDGRALDAFLARNACDVVVLDLGLPGEDGISIATRLRTREDLRIVMLTARVSVLDRIQGFDAGADVYLTKPVDMLELVKVVQSVARRMKPSQQMPLLDMANTTLTMADLPPVRLTTKELQLLRQLALAPEQSLPRTELGHMLWDLDDSSAIRRLEVLVSRLRIKLKQAGLPELIKTEWQMGYRLARKLHLK